MLFLNLRSGNGRLSHLAVTPGEAMEIHMKFTRPGLLITALLMTSPAFAQYGSPGTTLAPSVAKDDSWDVTQRVKKHVANHKHKKHMEPQATASGHELQSADDRLCQPISTHTKHQQERYDAKVAIGAALLLHIVVST